MIRFFRRIRERLPSDGRLGKSLLYATGDILPAAQVNDWDEQHLKQKRSSFAEEQLTRGVQANLGLEELPAKTKAVLREISRPGL